MAGRGASLTTTVGGDPPGSSRSDASAVAPSLLPLLILLGVLPIVLLSCIAERELTMLRTGRTPPPAAAAAVRAGDDELDAKGSIVVNEESRPELRGPTSR